ncbi:hypothetical protein K2X30_04245 [bacterium]|nr:hypothetical protein [bacterium]
MDTSIWDSQIKNINSGKGYQEVWYLTMMDPKSLRALTLRFSILSSHNGFRKIAETWAIYFERTKEKEMVKSAVKQTFDIREFSSTPTDGGAIIKIANSFVSPTETRGKIQSKGQGVSWDLKIDQSGAFRFNAVPELLQNHPKLFQHTTLKSYEALKFSGTSEIGGEKQEWKDVPGVLTHSAGTRSGESWVWAHCNTFVNEQNQPVPFVFEGWEGKRKLGPLLSPRVSSLYFVYQNQEYKFKSLWDNFKSRSKSSLTEWEFQVEKDDLLFKGSAKSELKDFAGLTYEDTDGSLVYCAHSKLSDITITVYRRGKLECTLKSAGTAALEFADRKKNPYVALLV